MGCTPCQLTDWTVLSHNSSVQSSSSQGVSERESLLSIHDRACMNHQISVSNDRLVGGLQSPCYTDKWFIVVNSHAVCMSVTDADLRDSFCFTGGAWPPVPRGIWGCMLYKSFILKTWFCVEYRRVQVISVCRVYVWNMAVTNPVLHCCYVRNVAVTNPVLRCRHVRNVAVTNPVLCCRHVRNVAVTNAVLHCRYSLPWSTVTFLAAQHQHS